MTEINIVRLWRKRRFFFFFIEANTSVLVVGDLGGEVCACLWEVFSF